MAVYFYQLDESNVVENLISFESSASADIIAKSNNLTLLERSLVKSGSIGWNSFNQIGMTYSLISGSTSGSL